MRICRQAMPRGTQERAQLREVLEGPLKECQSFRGKRDALRSFPAGRECVQHRRIRLLLVVAVVQLGREACAAAAD